MKIQDKLRRLASQMPGRSIARDVLMKAAQEIDELEAEVERLKKEKENRC